tara:strand:+ start:3831 stop:4961 length:1131 start_codon:yes stop_codon:yes gene_type:complete
MAKRPVLIVSPIPSHPQNQGNSARIYRLGRMFQLAGHPVHFIYLGLEGLTQQQALDHRSSWDRFYYIEPTGPAPEPSLGEYYHVDDWFDDRITTLVDELCQHWDYAVCLSNYVWCSRHLDVVPTGTLKVIDTHDVFGDRHLVARAAGFEPVWFYTSKALEAMALRRADLVIAIQDEEEAYFRDLTEVPVVTIGYAIPEHPLPSRQRQSGEKLRVGYLGSGNPFNVESICQFQQAVLLQPELLDRYQFHLAGTICTTFATDSTLFDNWGMVDDVADFYREMDILINPMVGGTGLKIKSVEVLAYGKPLLATWDAMVGICNKNEKGIASTVKDITTQLIHREDKNLTVCLPSYTNIVKEKFCFMNQLSNKTKSIVAET